MFKDEDMVSCSSRVVIVGLLLPFADEPARSRLIWTEAIVDYVGMLYLL